MDTPCEFAVKFLFPIVRAELSRTLLNKFKLTQIETANKLGITQAAVSQYLNEKRGTHLKSLSTEIQGVILNNIGKLDLEKIKELNKEGLRDFTCNICQELKRKKYI